ncbi:recombinase family protein [Corynebacterium heidelbergense]|uniref:recombinase family protein n=1 Tax=Corynebacterium heidelbergense TaxID=2055947 RepID=UPI00269A124C
MVTLLGYARVSTRDQDTRMQVDALTARGCERIYTDTGSGLLAERSQLTQLLDYVLEGDTVVVWRLDRLVRSIRNLIDQIDVLQSCGIGFISLQENIDTTTSGGRLVFHIFFCVGAV